MFITVEKRLKQGGYISSVIPLWPLQYFQFFYIHVFSDVDKKRYKCRKGIIIYMTYVFKKAMFLKTGEYTYIYLGEKNK